MRERLLIFIYSIITIFICFIMLINVIEYNVLSKRFENKKLIFSILPQGWAFFTRNSREGQVILYQKENDILKKVPYQHNHYQFAFGLDRTTTKVYTELGLIKNKIHNNLFQEVEWNYQSDIYQKDLSALRKVDIKSPLKKGKLKGEYLMIIQEPIPWAWSKNMDSIKMPAVAIFINIIE